MTAIVEIFVGLMLAVVALALVARKLQIPYPILFVIGGLGLGVIPGLPQLKLDPELVFVFFLPPLLFPAAMFTSWRDFRANLRPISLLAIGLVLFTTVAVAYLTHYFMGLPLAAGFVLGLCELQMNKTHNYRGTKDNQLRTLQHIGIFTNYPYAPRSNTNGQAHSIEDQTIQNPNPSATNNSDLKALAKLPKLTDPYDSTQPLEARARSYLHVNCSVCHVRSGGGNAMMELGFATKREEMNLLGARPQHATFEISNAMLVAPGDADRSVLLQRLSRRGAGQMPPLVLNTVDEQALALFRAWIAQMKPEQQFVRAWVMEDFAPLLDQAKHGRSFSSGQAAFKQVGCAQCHKFAGEGGSVGPELTRVASRLQPREILESMILPSKVIAEGYAATEVETKSGTSVSGRVVREDDHTLVLLPQTANAEPITIKKNDIRRRELSKISNMPTGILNTLQTNQVLDLLAYLISDGNSNHLSFVGASH